MPMVLPPVPPPTAPEGHRRDTSNLALPKMASTVGVACIKAPCMPSMPRPEPANTERGQLRSSKYFPEHSCSKSPRNLPRRTPSPAGARAMAGDGMSAARALQGTADNGEGPTPQQGSRLHFDTQLGYETTAGGTVYGAGSFDTHEALADFLAQCNIDTTAWQEGTAKGTHGLFRELEKREAILQVEDRRLVRCVQLVQIRVQHPGSNQYLFERRVASPEPIEVLESSKAKNVADSIGPKINLWHSATRSIFSSNTMLTGNACGAAPEDAVQRLAQQLASHVNVALHGEVGASAETVYGQSSGLMRAIASKLKEDANHVQVDMLGAVNEQQEYALSEEFPGLATKNTFYEYAVRIPILPGENFQTITEVGSQRITHHWEWRAVLVKHEGLALKPTQLWLIEGLFAGCLHVEVSKLHPYQDEHSDSMMLRTRSYDVNGEPDEPTVTMLAHANDIVEEVKRTQIVLDCGVDAIMPTRPPIFADSRSRDALLFMDSKIDSPLREHLRDGSIRLLRCSWVASEQADDELGVDLASGAAIMSRRKDLPGHVFFSVDEAVELLDRGDRSVLVLSQCWQTHDHPDPHGLTLSAVRQFLRHDVSTTCCGLLWDWPSVELTSWINRDIQYSWMATCFMSIAGTSVLQLKDVPPRLHQYDGLVMLSSLPLDAEEEEMLRMAAEFGNVLEYEISGHKAAVQFASHAEAVDMVRNVMAHDSFSSHRYQHVECHLAYNDRPYDGADGRGWSIFEQGVSLIVAAHVESAQVKGQLPQRFKLAQATRPKVIDISKGATRSLRLLADPGAIMRETVAALGTAHFDVKDDRRIAQEQLSHLDAMMKASEVMKVCDLDNLGAVVLGMKEACWVLPEYTARLHEVVMLTPLKEHVMHQLTAASGRPSSPGGEGEKVPIIALRELWGPGGALNTMAYQTVRRGDVSIVGQNGLVDQTLFAIVENLRSALFAPLDQISEQALERARDVGYTPSPPVQYQGLHASVTKLLCSYEFALVGQSDQEYAKRFESSFVLHGDASWSDAENHQALIDVIQLLSRAKMQDETLRGLKGLDLPVLETYAHKNLNLENVIVDAAGSLWLCSLSGSGYAGMFEDACKICAELLFECFPIPFTFTEVQSASVQRLVEMFQLSFEAAARLKETALGCSNAPMLSVMLEGDLSLAFAISRIDEDAVAVERAREACQVIEALLAPIHINASEVTRVPTLLQLASSLPPASWPSHAKLMLKLITTIIRFSYELCAKGSQREQAQATGRDGAPHLAGDLHVAHFLLPLLRLSLQSLCDRTLSMWQKRVAWKGSLMLASASCEAIRRPSKAPAMYQHRSQTLMLAPGQILALRTSESRMDGGSGSIFPIIVGACEQRHPTTYDSCGHVVLPWTFRERGGGAAAVIECGALHDFQVELPLLAALKTEVPVPPDPSLCMPFDVPKAEMVRITEDLLSRMRQVLTTCKTPAVRGEVERSLGIVQDAWKERSTHRAKYEKEMFVEEQMGIELVQEINLLQGDRWRKEALQRKRAVDIVEAKESSIKKAQDEKAILDNMISLERRKLLKFKNRLMMLKENIRKRVQEQASAEREADAKANSRMKQRLTSTRDETLEEQANRERAEADQRLRRKNEDASRQRLAEEEAREKAYIQKREIETKKDLTRLQLECSHWDRCLGAAKEIDDKVRKVDGEKIMEKAWLAVDIREAIGKLRNVGKTTGLDMSGTTTDQKFDDAVKNQLKPFALRHPRITALLRKEMEISMEDEAQQKKASERKDADPFVDSIVKVRTAMDEYDDTELVIADCLVRENVAKGRQQKHAADEAKLRKTEMQQQVAYCNLIFEAVRFDLEQAMLLWSLSAISKTGSVGARDYADGQQLIVRCADGIWRDAVILEPPSTDGDSTHFLRIDSDDDVWEEGDSFGTETRMTLHPFNHAPRELPIATFDIMRARWARTMRAQHATLVDHLTGSRIDVTQLRVAVTMVVKKLTTMASVAASQRDLADLKCPLGGVGDASMLTDWLQRAHALRCNGDASFRACLLLTGLPASGKSCLLSQIVVELLDGNEALDGNLVPIHVHVHDLQKRLVNEEDQQVFGQAWNWVDAYLQLVHGSSSELYAMLRQALMARRALILLDGIDEGGLSRGQILKHVTEVLAPQGHMLVISSRPSSAQLQGLAFQAHFYQLQLLPLSVEQQAQVTASRMSADNANKMQRWIKQHDSDKDSDKDSEEGQQSLASNPLMLMLLVSLANHRGMLGKEMPTSMGEVYETACRVMLERIDRTEHGAISSKVSQPHVSQLLEAVFLEAHNHRVRIIEEEHLEMAALSLAAPQQLKAIQGRGTAALRRSALKISCQYLPPELANAMRIVKERMMEDRLPILRLVQAEPLQMTSHLSFQEYYAARALCRGRHTEDAPWKWSPWWTNVLRFGNEMGGQFGRGLLRASGVTGQTLDLAKRLPRGDRSLALEAVMSLLRAKDTKLTCIDVSGNRLEEVEKRSIGEALLSNSTSKVSSIIADAFRLKVDDTELNVASMRIRAEGFVLLASALRSNAVITSLDVSSNYMVPWGSHERQKIMPVELCGIEAIGSSLSDSQRSNPCALVNLCLASNALGEHGAAVISSILTNRALRVLSVRDNKFGNDGVIAMLSALDKSPCYLTSLDVAENAVRAAGIKALATSLRKIKDLTHLDLSSNNALGNLAIEPLDMHGVDALSKAIGCSKVLSQVDLSANQLCGLWDDADTGRLTYYFSPGIFAIGGIQLVCDAISACASLKSITLKNNKIEAHADALIVLEAANKKRAKRATIVYES